MATVTKSSPVSNPKSLLEQIKTIEDRYTGYTSEALKAEIARRRAKLEKLQPGTLAYKDVAADLEDFECVLSMAETNEEYSKLLKGLFLADQLKQDHDFVTRELETALVGNSIDSPVEAPFGSVNFDKPEVTLPDEVYIELTGDVLPVTVKLTGATLSLDRIKDGHAFYTVS